MTNQTRIHIGQAANGVPFDADTTLLLRSNALIQANSGGGKSMTLRRMIEQAFGVVPQIVIDPEGEFPTLRAKFDFVLVGKGGDTPADMRSAKLLAHRLLELGASAVIDLYEMPKTQRPVWVSAFVQALVDAPKNLWRDLLVYVDEAHEFAPQAGHGVSESQGEKACRSALIDLAAKGRKRGFGVVAATQRLGKLSKDFAAELKNVMIGQTFMDIDRDRAAECLGIGRADKLAFFRDVKMLKPGTFFALGRAFDALESHVVLVGGVKTEHPEAGRRQAAPPPPTAKIKHLLPQLADLPKEAEDNLQTEKQLRARIAELERAAKVAPAGMVKNPAKAEVRIEYRCPKEIRRLVDVEMVNVVNQATDLQMRVSSTLADVMSALSKLQRKAAGIVVAFPEIGVAAGVRDSTPRAGSIPDAINRLADLPIFRQPAQSPARNVAAADKGGASRMLRALAETLKDGLSRRELGALAGVKASGGTFGTYLSRLRQDGLIEDGGAGVRITQAGRDKVGPVEQRTGRDLLEFWVPQLGDKPGKMLTVLFDSPKPISRGELAQAVGLAGDAGTFGTYLSRLVSRGLVNKVGKSDLAVSEAFRQ